MAEASATSTHVGAGTQPLPAHPAAGTMRMHVQHPFLHAAPHVSASNLEYSTSSSGSSAQMHPSAALALLAAAQFTKPSAASLSGCDTSTTPTDSIQQPPADTADMNRCSIKTQESGGAETDDPDFLMEGVYLDDLLCDDRDLLMQPAPARMHTRLHRTVTAGSDTLEQRVSSACPSGPHAEQLLLLQHHQGWGLSAATASTVTGDSPQLQQLQQHVLSEQYTQLNAVGLYDMPLSPSDAVGQQQGAGSAMRLSVRSALAQRVAQRERNRDAQRRFREKQRGVLVQYESLVRAQAAEIESLKRANRMASAHTEMLLNRVRELEAAVGVRAAGEAAAGAPGAPGLGWPAARASSSQVCGDQQATAWQ